MSSRNPRLTGTEIIKFLNRQGFEISRIRGSHHFLKHKDGRATVVPVHRGETIGPGLLGKISKDTEIEVSEFKK